MSSREFGKKKKSEFVNFIIILPVFFRAILPLFKLRELMFTNNEALSCCFHHFFIDNL